MAATGAEAETVPRRPSGSGQKQTSGLKTQRSRKSSHSSAQRVVQRFWCDDTGSGQIRKKPRLRSRERS